MAGIYHQAGCCYRPGRTCQDAVCLTDQQSNPLVVITGDCECAGTAGGPYEFAGYVPYDPQA